MKNIPMALSLSELGALIQESIETMLPDTYWVCAEIASMSERSGHLYLELVEKGARETLIAKQRATCWSHVQTLLRAYFEQETGRYLATGMKVRLEVEVRYHALYGLSLNIVGIDPRYTLGDLAQQRLQTIARLQEEGVFDMQRALELPRLVQRLAVISAASAAGYGDFDDQLQQSGYRFSTTLFAATMQGDRAEQSILAALATIAEVQEDFDAVVIIRGGGATTDLGCFDLYSLCAHCAQFPLPILTGIGHTRDVSVLDMVAHEALKTPTAVAAYLVERMDTEAERLKDLLTRLRRTAERQILVRQHAIDLLAQRLRLCSPERIYQMGYCLTKQGDRIVRSINDLQAGDRLTTYLQDGAVESVVQ